MNYYLNIFLILDFNKKLINHFKINKSKQIKSLYIFYFYIILLLNNEYIIIILCILNI